MVLPAGLWAKGKGQVSESREGSSRLRPTEPWSWGEGVAGTNTPTSLPLLPGPCYAHDKFKQKVESEEALMQPIQVRLWAQSRAGKVGVGPNRQRHPAQVVSFWFLFSCEPST